MGELWSLKTGVSDRNAETLEKDNYSKTIILLFLCNLYIINRKDPHPRQLPIVMFENGYFFSCWTSINR